MVSGRQGKARALAIYMHKQARTTATHDTTRRGGQLELAPTSNRPRHRWVNSGNDGSRASGTRWFGYHGIVHEHLKQNANGLSERAVGSERAKAGRMAQCSTQKHASGCFSSEFDWQRTGFSMVVRRLCSWKGARRFGAGAVVFLAGSVESLFLPFVAQKKAAFAFSLIIVR